MEFLWQVESGKKLFTHIFYGELYRSPEGFGFDIYDRNDDPFWVNNPREAGYNAPSKAKKLIQHLD